MSENTTIFERIICILLAVAVLAAVILIFIASDDVMNHFNDLKSGNEYVNANGKRKSYTTKDAKILGDFMYAQSEGCFEGISREETEKAMKYIGQIVLNWQKSMNRYEDVEIRDVIDSKVFSSAVASKVGNIDTPQSVYNWAKEVLRDGNYAPENLMHVSTSPMENHEEYAHIGKLYFYLD